MNLSNNSSSEQIEPSFNDMEHSKTNKSIDQQISSECSYSKDFQPIAEINNTSSSLSESELIQLLKEKVQSLEHRYMEVSKQRSLRSSSKVRSEKIGAEKCEKRGNWNEKKQFQSNVAVFCSTEDGNQQDTPIRSQSDYKSLADSKQNEHLSPKINSLDIYHKVEHSRQGSNFRSKELLQIQEQPFEETPNVSPLSPQEQQKLSVVASIHEEADSKGSQKQQLIDINEQTQKDFPQWFTASPIYQANSNNPIVIKPIQLNLLQNSKENLLTVKEFDNISNPNEFPSFSTINNLIGLEKFTKAVNFKPKHYPSTHSTESEIKLYGKRLYMSFLDIFNPLQISNLEVYEIDNQYIAYYLPGSNREYILLCYFNHTVYLGEYQTGPRNEIIRQGYGLQYFEGKYFYQGDFYADKKHGFGCLKGGLAKDSPHRNSAINKDHRYASQNEYIYIGYFMDGFIEGHGKQITRSNELYIGDYKLGQKDGTGRLIYQHRQNSDIALNRESVQVEYCGDFYDGFKQGEGRQTFKNGDSYTGSYQGNKFEGYGEYVWKNGTIYRGEFRNGQKHGNGVLINTKGVEIQKVYQNNKQVEDFAGDIYPITSRKILKTNQSQLSLSRRSSISNALSEKIKQKLDSKGNREIDFKNIKQKAVEENSHIKKSEQKEAKKPNKNILHRTNQRKSISDIARQKQLESDYQNLNNLLKTDGDSDLFIPKRQNIVKNVNSKSSHLLSEEMSKIKGKMFSTVAAPEGVINFNISKRSSISNHKLQPQSSRKSLHRNLKGSNQLAESNKQTKKFIYKPNMVINFDPNEKVFDFIDHTENFPSSTEKRRPASYRHK